jgi:hypothetical protein
MIWAQNEQFGCYLILTDFRIRDDIVGRDLSMTLNNLDQCRGDIIRPSMAFGTTKRLFGK